MECYDLVWKNQTINLFTTYDIYKFITLLPKDYCLIPGNGVKNLFTTYDIYKFITLLPKDYYLIPGNGAKNLLGRPNDVYVKIWSRE